MYFVHKYGIPSAWVIFNPVTGKCKFIFVVISSCFPKPSFSNSATTTRLLFTFPRRVPFTSVLIWILSPWCYDFLSLESLLGKIFSRVPWEMALGRWIFCELTCLRMSLLYSFLIYGWLDIKFEIPSAFKKFCFIVFQFAALLLRNWMPFCLFILFTGSVPTYGNF